MKATAAVLTSVVLAAIAGAAQAQAPDDVSDLIGARAAGGETALRSRGYAAVGGETGDDRKYVYWWNAGRRQCLSVAIMDGRYASIVATPAPDCNQRGGAPRDREDRRGGRGSYRPDIGYRQDAPPPRQSPSYFEDRAPADRVPIQIEGKAVELGLVCFGDGQRPGLATTYGWSWNSRRDRYDYGNRTELTAQQFDASVMIQLWGGGGRISLPRKLIPPINTRGSDGWWELHDIDAGPDVIHAKYRLNGLNKPAITINRRSGQITIQGMAPYGFRGSCDLIDGKDHRRF